MTEAAKELQARIKTTARPIDGFPQPGVRFIDIGPVVADADLFAACVSALCAPFASGAISHVVGLEARGLYFAGAIAARLGAGLVPARKPGKLPLPLIEAKGTILDLDDVADSERSQANAKTYRKPYEFEISAGVLDQTSRVLVVDDLLAKGGSIHACRQLVEKVGATMVGAGVVIELGGLGGRRNLSDLEIRALAVF